MSLPRELLDQLLTGYLDDALSADERTRVERLLQSDPEMVDELSELRIIRRSLKAVSQVDSAIKLEKGFSDRVLGAAVARARAEGLGDDHPLVRLAEQPSTTRATTHSSHSHPWRVASLLVGLAASIVIAVVTFRPSADETSLIAAVQPNPEVVEADPLVTPDIVPDAPEAIEPEMIASADPTPGSVSPSPIEKDPIVDPAPITPPIEAIAKSTDPAMDTVETPTVPKIEIPATGVGGHVLVVDVRRTVTGREGRAVQKAMDAARIDPASKMQITDQIAGYVTEKVEAAVEEGKASVLYLRVPGKKFDLFYQTLWADEKGIESCRMTLSLNAPFVKVVDAIRPDPTTIRHDNAAFELSSGNGVLDQLVRELGQLEYPPIRDRKGSAPGLSTGRDIQADVLVLVR
jgi:hypothetical protein